MKSVAFKEKSTWKINLGFLHDKPFKLDMLIQDRRPLWNWWWKFLIIRHRGKHLLWVLLKVEKWFPGDSFSSEQLKEANYLSTFWRFHLSSLWCNPLGLFSYWLWKDCVIWVPFWVRNLRKLYQWIVLILIKQIGYKLKYIEKKCI